MVSASRIISSRHHPSIWWRVSDTSKPCLDCRTHWDNTEKNMDHSMLRQTNSWFIVHTSAPGFHLLQAHSSSLLPLVLNVSKYFGTSRFLHIACFPHHELPQIWWLTGFMPLLMSCILSTILPGVILPSIFNVFLFHSPRLFLNTYTISAMVLYRPIEWAYLICYGQAKHTVPLPGVLGYHSLPPSP